MTEDMMARADPERIETVLSIYDAGRRPKGEDVDTVLKGRVANDTAPASPEDIPGMAGLHKVAALVERDRLARVKELLGIVLVAVVTACEPKTRGRAIIKSLIRSQVRLQAEEAHAIVNAMIGRHQRDGYWKDAVGHLSLEPPETDTGWARLLACLKTLERIEHVPSAEVPTFLIETAVPQISWRLALSDEDVAKLYEAAREKNAPETKKTGEGGCQGGGSQAEGQEKDRQPLRGGSESGGRAAGYRRRRDDAEPRVARRRRGAGAGCSQAAVPAGGSSLATPVTSLPRK